MLLAAASQVVASQLRLPALIILLPVGFIAGAVTTHVNPQKPLGPAFQPLVSLAAAVTLDDAGPSPQRRKVHGRCRGANVEVSGRRWLEPRLAFIRPDQLNPIHRR